MQHFFSTVPMKQRQKAAATVLPPMGNIKNSYNTESSTELEWRMAEMG